MPSNVRPPGPEVAESPPTLHRRFIKRSAAASDIRKMAVAGAVFLVLLALGMPARGVLRYNRLRASVGADPDARARFYLASAPLKLGLAAFAAVFYLHALHRHHAVHLGPANSGMWWTAVPFAGGLALGAVRVRRMARTDEGRAHLRRALCPVALVVPRTHDERTAWIVASITAGITEEMIYRGFVVGYVVDQAGLRDFVTVTVVSSVLFGLAHAYQGVRGVVLTSAIGAGLLLVAATAGLLVAMLLHVLLDVRLLVVPADIAETVDISGSPTPD